MHHYKHLLSVLKLILLPHQSEQWKFFLITFQRWLYLKWFCLVYLLLWFVHWRIQKECEIYRMCLCSMVFASRTLWKAFCFRQCFANSFHHWNDLIQATWSISHWKKQALSLQILYWLVDIVMRLNNYSLIHRFNIVHLQKWRFKALNVNYFRNCAWLKCWIMRFEPSFHYAQFHNTVIYWPLFLWS